MDSSNNIGTSNVLDIYLLDYGQELSKIDISDLYCLPKKFSLLKAQAFPISLKNVYNKIIETDLPIGHLSSESEPHSLWTNHNAKKITQELNSGLRRFLRNEEIIFFYFQVILKNFQQQVVLVNKIQKSLYSNYRL